MKVRSDLVWHDHVCFRPVADIRNHRHLRRSLNGFEGRVRGLKLPTVVVIGAPMAIFAAVMLHGLKVEKRVKRRRKSKTTNR
jgi:hypothetical protein